MPIYEYRCSECGRRVEVLQRLSEPDPAACHEAGVPEGHDPCHGSLARQLSVPGGYAMGRSSSPAPPAEMCGTCDRPQGSCAWDN